MLRSSVGGSLTAAPLSLHLPGFSSCFVLLTRCFRQENGGQLVLKQWRWLFGGGRAPSHVADPLYDEVRLSRPILSHFLVASGSKTGASSF